MKLNNDCARKILLEIENIAYGETMTIEKLQTRIPEFSIDEVLAIVTTFNKSHHLRLVDKASYDEGDIYRDNKIKCLTERGYKTLDLIRDDEVWKQIKEAVPNFNELSIYTIINIADKIMNVKYNELFDLPKHLLVDNSRY